MKCDEIQPRCGPCTRLHRECDWEVRWNFSDATSSTQSKHSNVTTSGSAVWDPTVKPDSPRNSDSGLNLPAFATLTNDEDRERKAESTLPGTYSVVVTPKSFADLPEYAISGESSTARGQTSARHSARIGSGRSDRTRSDPNIIVLDRFEDLSPTTSVTSPLVPPTSQGNLPETLQHMSLSVPSVSSTSSQASTPVTHYSPAEGRLVSHFRRYIVTRLVPKNIEENHGVGSTPIKDIFEDEAAKFPPLHHAICALSALNLSYRGQATLEEAIEHYDRALSAHTPTPSADDLLSDGVFLRHYLLFIYDICMTVDANDAGSGMWVDHLRHLVTLTRNRVARFGKEPHAFVMHSICAFDTYACLMGNGNCDYFRTVLAEQIVPPLGASLTSALQRGHAIWPNEAHTYPVIMNLMRGVMIHTSNLAQAAQQFRREAADRTTVSPGRCARWQAQVFQMQTELSNFWQQRYPDFLEKDSPMAGQALDVRMRYVFEHAFLLYQASTLYSRTSMFPSQSLIPTANQAAVHADTNIRVSHILTLTMSIFANGGLDRREVVFPIFMAGVATTNPNAKGKAIELLKSYEGHGIGQNTSVVRRLLVAVCEEQNRRVAAGRRMEEVEWLRVGRERGLSVVNCGL